MRRGVALLLFCTKKFGQFDALLEYGVEKEGYWTGEKFMENVKDAVQIDDYIYPSDAYTVVWVFDQSSCQSIR